MDTLSPSTDWSIFILLFMYFIFTYTLRKTLYYTVWGIKNMACDSPLKKLDLPSAIKWTADRFWSAVSDMQIEYYWNWGDGIYLGSGKTSWRYRIWVFTVGLPEKGHGKCRHTVTGCFLGSGWVFNSVNRIQVIDQILPLVFVNHLFQASTKLCITCKTVKC